MHLARRTLREAAADATVTDIATEFGFWELGRFAVEYKACSAGRHPTRCGTHSLGLLWEYQGQSDLQ
jgi:hypothetical protein